MSPSPILLTGAAGRIGGVAGEVVDILRRKGQPVRAPVPTDDHRAQALRATGAEVVVGDLERSPTRSVSALLGWLGNMLIDKNRIAVGIGQDETRGPGRRFVGLGLKFETAALESPLKRAHVIKFR